MSTKVCLKFNHRSFFQWKRNFFGWTYLLKKKPRRAKILISPVWNKILNIWDTLFEFIQTEVQCSKNYFKKFLPQEAGAFGNNVEKEPQKPCPKLKRYVYYIFTENICSACNPMQVVIFLQKCILILKNSSSYFLNLKVSWYLHCV